MDITSYTATQTKTVTVTVDEDVAFDVTVNSAKATQRFFKTAAALAAEGDILASLEVAQFVIVGLVTDWDLTSGGEKLPVTGEAVEDLPVQVSGAIVSALFEAENPGND